MRIGFRKPPIGAFVMYLQRDWWFEVWLGSSIGLVWGRLFGLHVTTNGQLILDNSMHAIPYTDERDLLSK